MIETLVILGVVAALAWLACVVGKTFKRNREAADHAEEVMAEEPWRSPEFTDGVMHWVWCGLNRNHDGRCHHRRCIRDRDHAGSCLAEGA